MNEFRLLNNLNAPMKIYTFSVAELCGVFVCFFGGLFLGRPFLGALVTLCFLKISKKLAEKNKNNRLKCKLYWYWKGEKPAPKNPLVKLFFKITNTKPATTGGLPSFFIREYIT